MIRRSRKRMTIVQLKRHIDRRFATKNELQQLRNDLQRFATKDDLQRFATKDDLTAFEGRMNARFDDMTRQFERQFESLNAKIDGFFKFARDRIAHHDRVGDEHEKRLQDLEAQARS